MAKTRKQSDGDSSALDNFKSDQTRGSAKTVLEELFNDFHRNRRQVYMMNLVRGIFFGFGSVIGGTLVIALAVWLLSLFSDTWFGPLVRSIQDALR